MDTPDRPPPRLIDSHAHLDTEKFAGDLDAVMARAAEAGVDHILTIGTDLASSERAVALAERDPRLFASAGVHPHDAGKCLESDWDRLEQLWGHDRVVAVGETGLDYYYDFSPRDAQKAVFQRHLEASGRFQKPVVVHIRDSFDDAFDLMQSVGLPAGGVVHCFTGGPKECERALALGLYVSIPGVVTFKNGDDLRAAVPMIPADRLLVETDSPFLAPLPFRGKRNEPAFVVHTARKVAEVRGVDFETLCSETRANTIRLFNLKIA